MKLMNQSVKNITILASLISLMLSVSATAATTGSITLSGTVLSNASIVVTPASGYNTLNLSTGSTDLLVATVREKNNSRLGYSVTMSSANAGFLKYIVSGTTLSQVAYTAKYNGSAQALSVAAVTITNVTSQASTVDTTKNLSVSFAGDPTEALLSGSYVDTLTFSITAN